MSGAFSTIMDAISLVGKSYDSSDIASMSRALNNTKSISERARKSIFVYPVLFSSGMADLDIDFSISKFLELQYGIFTLMTVGLNPSIENGDIGQYLNSISAESVESVKLSFKTVNPNDVKTWYEIFGEENKDFFEEYKYSLENSKYNPFDKINTKIDNTNEQIKSLKDEVDKTNAKFNSLSKKKEDIENVNSNPFEITGDVYSNDGSLGIKLENLEKKLGDASPTMITLDLKIKGYENSFKVPIALKASPHFLKAEDLAALFDSAIEDKRLLTRIVRLKSGEISFFKDFLFNMDRIKRDQKLYQTFGQHPWYQQFINRKEKNKAKKIGIIASTIMSKGKEVVSATSNYLPTASIILTIDELERSTKMKYGFLLKNEKIMWETLEHLGLLSVGIYIPENETVTFYFNGFKKPMIMRIKDLKNSKGGDSTSKMVDLMTLMMKRGIM